VVHPDGYLLTNVHVVQPAGWDHMSRGKIHAVELEVRLGERRYPARVLQTDRERDLALIKIEAEGLAALPLADADGVQLAEDVYVVGFPAINDVLSDGVKVTRGAISGIERTGAERMFLTDAAINPGNSGGPMVNDRGEVVGVATAKIVRKSVENVGLCVPVSHARRLLEAEGIDLPVGRGEERLSGVELAQRATPSVARIQVEAISWTLTAHE
jgi:S1-C subfamily serine protease